MHRVRLRNLLSLAQPPNPRNYPIAHIIRPFAFFHLAGREISSTNLRLLLAMRRRTERRSQSRKNLAVALGGFAPGGMHDNRHRSAPERALARIHFSNPLQGVPLLLPLSEVRFPILHTPPPEARMRSPRLHFLAAKRWGHLRRAKHRWHLVCVRPLRRPVSRESPLLPGFPLTFLATASRQFPSSAPRLPVAGAPFSPTHNALPLRHA